MPVANARNISYYRAKRKFGLPALLGYGDAVAGTLTSTVVTNYALVEGDTIQLWIWGESAATIASVKDNVFDTNYTLTMTNQLNGNNRFSIAYFQVPPGGLPAGSIITGTWNTTTGIKRIYAVGVQAARYCGGGSSIQGFGSGTVAVSRNTGAFPGLPALAIGYLFNNAASHGEPDASWIKLTEANNYGVGIYYKYPDNTSDVAFVYTPLVSGQYSVAAIGFCAKEL